MQFLFSVTFLRSLFLLIIFEFQKMKFLSTIIATMTSGLVFQPISDNLSQPSLFVPRPRSKRDLIGFNRQINNNFSHGRHWDNRMGM